MAEMTVEFVSVDRPIWSGKATFVFARTLDGEIGIMPNHSRLVGQLVDDAQVRIDSVDSGELTFAVDGGFLLVSDEGVTILAEDAQLADEIDVEKAERDAASDDPKTSAGGRARLRASGRTVE